MTFWTIQNIGLRALWSDCTSTQWLLCFTESIKAMLTSWLYWELWLLSFMLRFKRKLIISFGYKSGSLPGKVKLQQLMVEFSEHTWAKRAFIGLECKVRLTNHNLTISFKLYVINIKSFWISHNSKGKIYKPILWRYLIKTLNVVHIMYLCFLNENSCKTL